MKFLEKIFRNIANTAKESVETQVVNPSVHQYEPEQLNKIAELEAFLGTNLKRLTDFSEFFNENYKTKIPNAFFIDQYGKIVGLKVETTKLKDLSLFTPFANLLLLSVRGQPKVPGNLTDISGLRFCPKLKHLVISRNSSILDIDPIGNLDNLETLNLSGVRIVNPSCLSSLTKLKNLNLIFSYRIQGNDLSFLKKMSNLQSLCIKGWDISDCTPIHHLKDLQFLDLGNNKLESCDTLRYLDNLLSLNLSCNPLTDIKGLIPLKKLQHLDLDQNYKIIDHSPLSSLKSLEKLNLNTNQIKDINEFKKILTLEYLQELVISESPLNWREDSIHKHIPKEIISQVAKTKNPLPLKNYFRDIKKGKGKNNSVKVILIGNGNVGKTQIAKRLVEDNEFVFDEQHKSTHGIVILNKKLDDLNVNIWDFAGQDIYYSTHRLFLKTRALFLLVWDIENENKVYHEYKARRYKNEKLIYWLEYVRLFSQNSPILIIQNKVDTDKNIHTGYFSETKESLKSSYPIIEFLQTSAKNGYNFDVLKYWIKESFSINDRLRREILQEIPLPWIDLAEQLGRFQSENRKTLSYQDFRSLCEKYDLTQSFDTLLKYYHDTGLFYYSEGYFNNQIILNQSWAIDAVYAALDRESFYFRIGKINKGRLKYGNLVEIWKENTDEERMLFIGFMMSAELCFEVLNPNIQNPKLTDREFVAPQLLPESKPQEVEFLSNQFNIDTYEEELKFRFLPTVYIQRFMVKASSIFNIMELWQNGILIQKENYGYAIVEANYSEKSIIVKSNNLFFIEFIRDQLEKIMFSGTTFNRKKQKKFDDDVELGDKYLNYVYQSIQNTIENQVKDMVSKGNTLAALNLLLEFAKEQKHSALEADCLHQLGRYHILKKDFEVGNLDQDTWLRENVKILSTINYLNLNI